MGLPGDRRHATDSIEDLRERLENLKATRDALIEANVQQQFVPTAAFDAINLPKEPTADPKAQKAAQKEAEREAKLRASLARQVDSIRQSAMDENVLLEVKHAQQLATVDNAFAQEAISAQMHMQTRELLEVAHHEKLQAIRDEAFNKERERQMEQLQALMQMRFSATELQAGAEQRLAQSIVDGQEWSARNTLDTMMLVSGAMSKHSKKMFELNKAAQIGNAIIEAHGAITKALNAAPPPFNFALAAMVGAAAFAQVRAIQAQKFGGGASSASVGGGAGVSASSASPTNFTEPPAPVQAITVNVRDEQILTGRMLREIIEGIDEQINDGVRVSSLRVSGAVA